MNLRRFRWPDETGIFVVLLIVLGVFAALSESFRSASNGGILLLNGSVVGFLALGQTFVLLTGGIDLSTGAMIATTGVLAPIMLKAGIPWPIAALLTLGIGAGAGAISGIVVHYVKVPPFIATFAAQGVLSSIPLIITGANSVTVTDQGFAFIGQGYLAGIPVPVVLLILAAILGALFLRWTKAGVHLYAVGGNRAAARLAGVNIARTTILAYALSGMCGAFGGLIATSRLMVGFPNTGLGNELFFSIAAAVVGGVSLFGGIGSIPGAMIGAVLIATVSDGMNVTNVNSYWQPLVIGVIILLGVAIDTYRRSRRGNPIRLSRWNAIRSGRRAAVGTPAKS
ncbi:ABC transporter permease subunit [Galbitalea soli]|uniref:ABC transporter permease subunit n=1 Tax=Galbitalea soli TaxID=1268042 RepID=UPI00182005DF|nr:ribose transport system permease protein [Galbitalea soli]